MPNTHFPTLDEIFSPGSVAIIGASPEKAISFPGFHIHALKETGFPAIYPVNPRHKEAFGLPCYPSVSAIPGKVDHVVVCIPAEGSIELLKDCARKGVNSVHFFSAGFSESGEKQGIEMEEEMLKIARAGKFRIIGPNSTGLFVPKAKFTQATRLPMEPGPVAFISQSGGHSAELPRHAGPRGIRFSKVISYGNALDIGECELLEYFIADTETEIIAIYIEGVRDGRRFRDLLKKAAAKKPVVIYKGGITESGLRAAQSHTASITASVQVFQALCRQYNAILVDDILEMVDVLVALRFARPYPESRGIAVLGQGGGPSVQASDQMEAAGLKFSRLSKEINKELMTFLPSAGGIFSNPLDATNLVYPEIIYKTLKVLAKSPDINMMMYHLGFHPVTRWGEGILGSDFFLKPAVENFRKAIDETGKPVLLAMGAAADKQGMEEMLRVQEGFVKAGVPVFHDIAKAALAMARLADWYKRSKRMA
jgi:acyl-CoA synthetase (NDP forming)